MRPNCTQGPTCTKNAESKIKSIAGYIYTELFDQKKHNSTKKNKEHSKKCKIKKKNHTQLQRIESITQDHRVLFVNKPLNICQ